MNKDKKISALQYLKQELDFKVAEWGQLSDKDKEDLKRWAIEEMDILGIPHLN